MTIRQTKLGIVLILTVMLCACTTTKPIENIDKEAFYEKDISGINLKEQKNSLNENEESESSRVKASFSIDSFISLEKAALANDLKSDKKLEDIFQPYTIEGSFDLDSDGIKDKIVIKLTSRNIVNNVTSFSTSYLSVNNKSLELSFYLPGEVYLVDLDTRDKYIEIAIYDDGPSGDPNYNFYRYDGREIIPLGTIGDYVALDGLGRAISSSHIINFQPKVLLGVYELEGNKLSAKKLDFTEALNKEYTFSRDMEGYFMEMEVVPQDFVLSYPSNPEEGLKKFNKGEKFIIKEIKLIRENIPLWYFVEFENGKNGVLYFWIGD